MPRFNFVCGLEHVIVAEAGIDDVLPCPFCDGESRQAWNVKRDGKVIGFDCPGLFTPGSASVEHDRIVYQLHNKTHSGGTEEVNWKPVSPDDQCRCGNCATHRKRNSVTEVADVGKELSL